MTLSGIFCCRFLRLWRHDPVWVPPGGFRCRRCDAVGSTQGELLEVDDKIDLWKCSESTRKLLAGETAREPKAAPIVQHGGARSVVRAFTQVAV